MSAHIQLSAALSSISTIKDTTDCQSNAIISEASEEPDTSSESDDCVSQEVGSDTSEEDNTPLAHLTSNSWSDSDSDVPLSKLGNKS